MENIFLYIYKKISITKKIYIYFFLCKKLTNKYYEKRKKAPKRSTWKIPTYRKEEKEKRQKKAWGRYQNLTEEKKEKNRLYHRERNKNLSEEQQQKLVEYLRNYYLARKNNCFSRLIRLFYDSPRTIEK